jgi:hypothetical protein
LWSASGNFPNFSLFRYYAPASIILRGANPWHDIAVLACVAAGALLFALGSFRMRDITV